MDPPKTRPTTEHFPTMQIKTELDARRTDRSEVLQPHAVSPRSREALAEVCGCSGRSYTITMSTFRMATLIRFRSFHKTSLVNAH